MTGDFVTGQFFFDSRSAPPFGLEQRLTGALFDDPWGSVGRTIRTRSPRRPTRGRRRFTRCSSPCRTTSRRRGTTAGTSRFSGSSGQYGGFGDPTSATTCSRVGCCGRQPGLVTTPGATATAAMHGWRTDIRQCTTSLDQRRELSLRTRRSDSTTGYLDFVTDAGWQDYQGLLLSVQRRLGGGYTTSANYTVSRCEGLISQGQSPLNVATGYQIPVSLINPPSEAEAQKVYDADKGRCDAWRKHIFNITASMESPAVHQYDGRRLASGWMVSGVFRGSSGTPLTIQAGADRALSGMQATTSAPIRWRTTCMATEHQQLVQRVGIRACPAGHLRHVRSEWL